MIDIRVRVRDKYSVEFKTGFVIDAAKKEQDFMMNTWIFIPYSLDINRNTYPKTHFYRDVKSYIRLITPVYSLEAVSDEEGLPFRFLQVAFNEIIADPSQENMTELEYQIKMFTSIAKSALRQEAVNLLQLHDSQELIKAAERYVERVERITSLYRELKQSVDIEKIPKAALTYFAFGDEFFSNRIEHKTFEILESLKMEMPENYILLKEPLMRLINREKAYRISQGYDVMQEKLPKKNSALLHRLRLLRKYVENHLFLDADKKKDGRLAEQFYLSLAAGFAMIFATIISFSATQKYGNYTMPLFVALVVSYMLKDRIKDFMRYYYSSRLSKKYFDNKTRISIKDHDIGWIKEASDFVPQVKIPQEVIIKRERSAVLESDNRNTAEKIILYRKLVHINVDDLLKSNQYDLSGINDIVRFNFSSLALKMDDPEVPLFIPLGDEAYKVVSGKFIYYINFVVQLQDGDSIEYKRFRMTISRDGIEEVYPF